MFIGKRVESIVMSSDEWSVKERYGGGRQVMS